jgi:hypothetical protein
MIKEEIIQRADEYLEKISEAEMNAYMKQVAKDQEAMMSYVMSMADVFEEEDLFFDKFIFFFLLVHRSYTNRFRFFPSIDSQIIIKIEERDQSLLEKMMSKGEDEFEAEFEALIHQHPQRTLLDFITLDLFEANETEYDDLTLDLDNQIFFLIFTIVNIYEECLVNSQANMPISN